MKSYTTSRFREAFKDLPKQIQQQARDAYKIFKQNPFHPSLHFKQVHTVKPVYSVRVNADYRALGVRKKMRLDGFGSDHMLNTIR